MHKLSLYVVQTVRVSILIVSNGNNNMVDSRYEIPLSYCHITGFCNLELRATTEEGSHKEKVCEVSW